LNSYVIITHSFFLLVLSPSLVNELRRKESLNFFENLIHISDVSLMPLSPTKMSVTPEDEGKRDLFNL
jgi:hypothetical protein